MERKEDNLWGVISSLQKIEMYYENDLGKDNDNLKAYIWEIEKSDEHNKEVDLSQAIEKTKKFWKELITESIEELLKRILKNLQNSRIWQKSIYRMEQNEG